MMGELHQTCIFRLMSALINRRSPAPPALVISAPPHTHPDTLKTSIKNAEKPPKSARFSASRTARARTRPQPSTDPHPPTRLPAHPHPPSRIHAAAQPHRGARPGRRHNAPPQGPRRQGPPGAERRRGGEGDGRGGGGVGAAARVVLGGGRRGRAAAAPGARALRVRPPALHGRRVHHPHGQGGRAAARPGIRRHQGHARRRRRQALAQLAPRRAQHGLCRDAGGVHPVGHPRGAAAARRRRRPHDVHLPGHAGLRHPAPAAGGVPGLRDGLPRGQRLLLPLLLGPRRGRRDRGRRHAPRGPAGAGAPLRRAQHAPGGQAARVQGALHHRPGCRRRRGDPLRHALRMVLRRQERRRQERAGEALPQLPVPQGCPLTLALLYI